MWPSIAATLVLALTQDVGSEPGQLHQDLELPALDGSGPLRLSSLRGRRVLLIEFASW